MVGFVTKILSNDYFVYCKESNKTYTCKLKGQVKNNDTRVMCGEYVEFSFDEANNFALINKILPRKNFLIRPFVCNIDIALIVMSTKEPDFDSYLVDKLIVTASLMDIEPIILVSKCEFLDDDLKSLIENYRLAGYNVIEISSKNNINIDKVSELIEGKIVALCGQSAVGKSSLINSLSNGKIKKIGSYSEKLGRGRHETREVEFIKINNGYIADTPGFSRLEFKEKLPIIARVFKDFSKYANNCKYSSCLHINEPGCAVKEAVENNIIDKRRYNNYLHLISEIKDGKKVWVKK